MGRTIHALTKIIEASQIDVLVSSQVSKLVSAVHSEGKQKNSELSIL